MSEEKDLTPAERLEWLRARGITVETPEERKAKAIQTIMNETDEAGGDSAEGALVDPTNLSSGCNGPPANAASGIDASTKGNYKQEEGFSWTQTEEEIEMIIPMSDHGAATSKMFRVDFQSRRLRVAYDNHPLVDLQLFEAIDPEASTWILNRKDSNVVSLVITMDKTETALWARIKD